VASAGGAPVRITTPDRSLQETRHLFPYFLPDGRHFLYLAWGPNPANRAIYVGALDSDQKTRIMTVESKAVYAPPGFLLYQRQGTLFARAFDANRLTLLGEPTSIVDGLSSGSNDGNGAFDVSSSGTLVYRSVRSPANQRLVWLDRKGRQLGDRINIGQATNVALSPDEQWLAFRRQEPGASGGDIWIFEISTGVNSPLTMDPANEGEPVWSPDSRTVLFASNRRGSVAVFQRTLGGTDDVAVYESSEGSQWPDDWSRDGRYILINDRNTGIVALPTAGDRKPIRVVRSNTAVLDEAHLSHDGRWVAYVSTESGQPEIRVASFPSFTDVKQVSTNGGHQPMWRADGKELFYLTSDGDMMAVDVRVAGSRLEATAPEKLFAARVMASTPGTNTYAVSRDGSRFLVLGSDQDNGPEPITVILNWPSLLKQ
jgi:dipeptidyl aminopeptidase/acylaminoacyl peptidase